MVEYPATLHPPSIFPASSTNSSYFYNIWDHRISPYAYIERVVGGFVQSIDDQRSYLRYSLMSYLLNGGAQMMEKSVNIGDGTPTNEETDEIAIMFGEEPVGNRTYDMLWYKGCLLILEGRDGEVQVETYGSVKHPVESVHREFESFLAPRKRAAVSVLLSVSGGMITKSVDFEPPVIDDLELNYGVGFKKVDEQLVKKLQIKGAGLFILHGGVGVGKSYYIKHLTSKIDREFIFIPVGMAGDLASPSFVSLLLEHENAILVLEDAEQALQSREVDHGNSAVVSTILNLSDGVLGTVLSISILASFNANKQTIDKALLRRGRLQFSHKFNPLSVDDAKRLAVHLKKDPTFIANIISPTSLADLYNAEDDTGYIPQAEKVMGFGAL